MVDFNSFKKDVNEEVQEILDEYGVHIENDLSDEDIQDLMNSSYAAWQVANIICGIEE